LDIVQGICNHIGRSYSAIDGQGYEVTGNPKTPLQRAQAKLAALLSYEHPKADPVEVAIATHRVRQLEKE